MSDNLESEIIEVRNFCKQNSIVFFPGQVEECRTTNIDWEHNPETGVTDFLQIAKTCGVNILIIDIFTNDLLEEDLKSIASSDGVNKRMPDFRNSLKTVVQKRGETVSYSVTFFNNQVAYKFQKIADWADDYFSLSEMISNMEDEIGLLPDKEIESYARKIVTQKHYCDEKVSSSKIEFVRNYLAKNGVSENQDIHRIIHRAQQIFNEEILPKQEAELREKILEFKAKKISKVAVRSKLGITESLLDKYWY